ncbi:CBS domain-containing protein [Methanococcus aeolicus]|jgi:CBS domain-containing protein|uniref:CBS domain containing protein n=1 Tax=Methanococcus aeolicus (strain ATCC BAA-1280 / DSM 17508 / OCM 812 / Nankai-3) TaxID=419665 RepID=A6UTD4_META3|nr:CBS domain-containing protein [Methanococcus aeolicus]ABR55756.1 CBS domain containing protein [Methanococcus aeolicus Nankai-3]UXM84138.1 CBS domain-containing protein [Methanococcus aeolicus]
MEKIFNKKIKEIMTKDIIYSSPDEGVIKAFEILLKHKISCLPIVDADKKIMGIITTTDIGYNLIIDKYTIDTKVSDVMTKKVISVNPENTILDAINKMDEFGYSKEIINQLPVVEEDNKLVGIISDGDIIRVLSKSLKK